MGCDPAITIAVNTIAKREGFHATPFLDDKGDWRIGYGFSSVDGKRVTSDTPAMTEVDAMESLIARVSIVLSHVRSESAVSDDVAARICVDAF